MYTHVVLQALISISTSVPSGMPNGPFVTQDRFGTGKQKSLIIFDPTLLLFNILICVYFSIFLCLFVHTTDKRERVLLTNKTDRYI